ncbi:hypothetical protein DFQ28_005264 [Apophysomyces sp. BC1034]|nr:hypothetical protein DFQ30_003429 [Apophysomyces sp. BC1015]KAG0182810.1 hypothetical protein DFQ29_001975 [Apophysomyces sp. BC1021]KAG0193446.1 hypothetical protein DFQ28_005264 [Apophysomyces sp. BC1034]
MATTTTLMEFCTPPVPGETHKYYGYAHNNFIKLPQLATPPPSKPTVPPTKSKGPQKKQPQQKTLHSVASAGNLILLKQILMILPDPLKAVNDPHPSTGLTPMHFAASRGHVDIVRCLVEEYSVFVDVRDKEGETALLKAAYAGHYRTVQYLLSKQANVHHQDKDGWTALHNACSRCCLPIVRLLIDHGARVNARSKMGHTPLINAASKGHMSIVEYLLEEAHANPLIKNSFREAAYDVSAAACKSYICEMLEKAGRKWWDMRHLEGSEPSSASHGSTYDLLQFHVTVMIVLHENQRSTSILGLSRPHFSSSALTKHDTRGPWSLHPSGVRSSKDQVDLPADASGRGGSNWFWLTDWQIDYSDPRIDPTSGWQYARSFDEADDSWTPVAPTGGYGWVRRRRWVRVIKRRMDLAKGNHRGVEGEDSDAESQSDYVYQAEEIVQNVKQEDGNTKPTIQNLTRELRAYEEATQVLLAGIKVDYNQFRKHQASIQVTAHYAHIDKLNAQISAVAPKLSTPITATPVQHNSELVRELGFVRSTQGPPTPIPEPTVADFDANPWSRDAAPESAWSPLQNETSSVNQIDLVGHGEQDVYQPSSRLVDASEQGPRQFAWESDTEAKECRRCSRRFGLIIRRHHCRRCGLIVCDRCSASRTYLAPEQILQDPKAPTESVQMLASQHQRVCDKCYADLGVSA